MKKPYFIKDAYHDPIFLSKTELASILDEAVNLLETKKATTMCISLVKALENLLGEDITPAYLSTNFGFNRDLFYSFIQSKMPDSIWKLTPKDYDVVWLGKAEYVLERVEFLKFLKAGISKQYYISDRTLNVVNLTKEELVSVLNEAIDLLDTEKETTMNKAISTAIKTVLDLEILPCLLDNNFWFNKLVFAAYLREDFPESLVYLADNEQIIKWLEGACKNERISFLQFLKLNIKENKEIDTKGLENSLLTFLCVPYREFKTVKDINRERETKQCYNTKAAIYPGAVLHLYDSTKNYVTTMSVLVTDVLDKAYKYHDVFTGELSDRITSSKCYQKVPL